MAVTRKLRVDAAIARRKVELLAEFDVAVPELADILAAIDLHRLHGFSFWDARILLSAWWISSEWQLWQDSTS